MQQDKSRFSNDINRLKTEINVTRQQMIQLQKQIELWKQQLEKFGITIQDIVSYGKIYNVNSALSLIKQQLYNDLNNEWLNANDLIFSKNQFFTFATSYISRTGESMVPGISQFVIAIQLPSNVTYLNANQPYIIKENEQEIRLVRDDGELIFKKEVYLDFKDNITRLRPRTLVAYIKKNSNNWSSYTKSSVLDLKQGKILIQDEENDVSEKFISLMLQDLPTFGTVFINTYSIFGTITDSQYDKIMLRYVKHSLYLNVELAMQYQNQLLISRNNVIAASTLGGISAMNATNVFARNTATNVRVLYSSENLESITIYPKMYNMDLFRTITTKSKIDLLISVDRTGKSEGWNRNIKLRNSNDVKFTVFSQAALTLPAKLDAEIDWAADGSTLDDDILYYPSKKSTISFKVKRSIVSKSTEESIVTGQIEFRFERSTSGEWKEEQEMFAVISYEQPRQYTLTALGANRSNLFAIKSKMEGAMTARMTLKANNIIAASSDPLNMSCKINGKVVNFSLVLTQVEVGNSYELGYRSKWMTIQDDKCVLMATQLTTAKFSNYDVYSGGTVIAKNEAVYRGPLVRKQEYKFTRSFNSHGADPLVGKTISVRYDIHQSYVNELGITSDNFNSEIVGAYWENVTYAFLDSNKVLGGVALNRVTNYKTALPQLMNLEEDEKEPIGIQWGDVKNGERYFITKDYAIKNAHGGTIKDIKVFDWIDWKLKGKIRFPIKFVVEHSGQAIEITDIQFSETIEFQLPDGVTNLTGFGDQLINGISNIYLLIEQTTDLYGLYDSLELRTTTLEEVTLNLIKQLTAQPKGSGHWFMELLTFTGAIVGPFLPTVGACLLITGQIISAVKNFQERDVLAGVRDLMAAVMGIAYIGYKRSKRMNDRYTKPNFDKEKLDTMTERNKEQYRRDSMNGGSVRSINNTGETVLGVSYNEFGKSNNVTRIKSSETIVETANYKLVNRIILGGNFSEEEISYARSSNQGNLIVTYDRVYDKSGKYVSTENYGVGTDVNSFTTTLRKPSYVITEPTLNQYIEINASYVETGINAPTIWEIDEELINHMQSVVGFNKLDDDGSDAVENGTYYKNNVNLTSYIDYITGGDKGLDDLMLLLINFQDSAT